MCSIDRVYETLHVVKKYLVRILNLFSPLLYTLFVCHIAKHFIGKIFTEQIIFTVGIPENLFAFVDGEAAVSGYFVCKFGPYSDSIIIQNLFWSAETFHLIGIV